MSDLCHICGPVKHEAPTVICAPCALASAGVAPAATINPRAYAPNACPRCGGLMLTTSSGERCSEGCA